MTEIQINYKDFTPASNIKARLLIINNEWDQVLETIQKTLMYEPTDIEALRVYIFYLLSRENDPDALMEKFDELSNAFEMHEPKNAELHYNYSRLFARVCGRNKEILDRAMRLIHKAIALQPENSDFNTELGYQYCLIGNFTDAFSTYQQAAGYNETNMEPLYGMIYCRIKQDMLDDAEE
jgi:tetratricopeptide repeat protein 21B